MASFAFKGEQPVRKVYVGLHDINSSVSKFLRVVIRCWPCRGNSEASIKHQAVKNNGTATLSLRICVNIEGKMSHVTNHGQKKRRFFYGKNSSLPVRFGSITKGMVFRSASGTFESGFTVLQ